MNKDEIKKEDIIGERAYQERGLEIFLIIGAVVFLLLAILAFSMSDSYDYYSGEDYLDMNMLGMGIFCLALALFFAVFTYKLIKERLMNNRNPNPTVVVREDGVFVLYHANGRKEYLTDKITDVGCRGKIIFTLEKAGGLRYAKSVRHVNRPEGVVTRIKNILSYDDGKHAYTNYEKARLFCAYCGCKVEPKSGRCPSCGGKPAL